MASPPQQIDNRQPSQTLRTLTDDLLEEIFLRLPTPTDLARACTACAYFCRIITDRAFLRRFRAIHPPPPLGFLPNEEAGFLPAQPPHPSAPLARALADAADFSYSFVPTGRWLTPWRTRDVRQGRVLIECCPEDALDHPSLAMRQREGRRRPVTRLVDGGGVERWWRWLGQRRRERRGKVQGRRRTEE
ncbi:hypothetical protein PR202_gb15091 [Eleusine coracana subsp. coracana]|uniref:F-box domain-containing protein n=1 Tax=Eleusine coracana subsp. coracana TaxID=191504 RepID=A0AAV5EWW5_ELECO|nr:hypothetical protein PR202_gb15091 [Eleusine coracana subsp. coracana]